MFLLKPIGIAFSESCASNQIFVMMCQVNDMDLKGITREEAVLLLLSLQDQIQLMVHHRRDEYDHVVSGQRGDSFHIK